MYILLINKRSWFYAELLSRIYYKVYIMDLITAIVAQLRRDISKLVVSVQNVRLIKLVEL